MHFCMMFKKGTFCQVEKIFFLCCMFCFYFCMFFRSVIHFVYLFFFATVEICFFSFIMKFTCISA